MKTDSEESHKLLRNLNSLFVVFISNTVTNVPVSRWDIYDTLGCSK